MTITAGYDIGGAHLKVARVEDGVPVAVEQIPCPLWLGLDRLETALAAAAPLTSRADRHAVTMTGELCEIFPGRAAGVVSLVGFARDRLGPHVRIWMGERGLGTPDQAAAQTADVASTNFLATADVVARRLGDALLIDMGSTTTDIVPIIANRPDCGLTDAERLASGELVYTGLTRTPVPSVTRRAPFAGGWQALAADTFANMADVRRILGTLADDADQHATADGRGKSVADSLARFARGFGRDATDAELPLWQPSAAYVAERQLRAIHDAALAVTSNVRGNPSPAVVAAGIGAGVVAEVARRMDRECTAFGDLVNARAGCRVWATRCAPAVAVALIAADAS